MGQRLYTMADVFRLAECPSMIFVTVTCPLRSLPFVSGSGWSFGICRGRHTRGRIGRRVRRWARLAWTERTAIKRFPSTIRDADESIDFRRRTRRTHCRLLAETLRV